MKKVISIICLVLGIIALTTGIGIMYIEESNKQKALDALKTSIVNDYEKFKDKIEIFSAERTNIYQSLNNISYLTDVKVNYESIILQYQKYEETLSQIKEESEDLKVNCFKQDFKEVGINNKISAFVINYEQAVNYYIKDVNSFNEKIRQYNEWVKNVQVYDNYTELKEYVPLYTEYEDINNDGIYEGVN